MREQDTQRVKGRTKKSGFKVKFVKEDSSLVSRKLVNNFVETDDDTENCLKINQKDSAIVDIPVGLINYSNDCFLTL